VIDAEDAIFCAYKNDIGVLGNATQTWLPLKVPIREQRFEIDDPALHPSAIISDDGAFCLPCQQVEHGTSFRAHVG